MGGRKSYFIEDVVGENPERKRKFLSSAKSGSVEKVSQTSMEMFAKSDKVIDDLSSVFETLSFIDENLKKTPLKYEERKRLASKFWAKRKKKKKIDTNRSLDRIIVDSLAKVIRRGGEND